MFHWAIRIESFALCRLEHASHKSNTTPFHIYLIVSTGPFPSEILTLKKLEIMDLNDNYLIGTLPSAIREISNLRVLRLKGNDFHSTIPEGVFQLKNLEELSKLGSPAARSHGHEVLNCDRSPTHFSLGISFPLSFAVLDENLFSGTLPDQYVSSMQQLKILMISRYVKQSGRVLWGPLPSFSNMPNLEHLVLSGNAFAGTIPSAFASASSRLEVVDLENNALTGSVPPSLNSHADLQLFLSGNMISDLPQQLCDLDNWMQGAVGELVTCDAILCAPGSANALGRAVNTQQLCYQCPADTALFYGSTSCDPPANERAILSELFQDCGGPNWLRRDFWDTDAPYCSWFGVGCDDSGQVKLLNLQNNNLIGAIPSSIFELPHLEVLILSGNPIDFRFDNGVDRARRLRELRVDRTGLTTLHGVNLIKSLTVLDVGLNALRGPLSAAVLELPNLRVLSLRDNALTGYLGGYNWSQLKYLRVLRIDNNNFGGALPAFEELQSLTFAYLGGNSLTGTIPPNFLEFAPLHANLTVDLSDNQLSGSIPEELGRFKGLSLYLRNNKIGRVSGELCALAAANGWYDGARVESDDCRAVLCPPGTYNEAGRSTDALPDCSQCSSADNDYYGQTSCPPPTVTGSSTSGAAAAASPSSTTFGAVVAALAASSSWLFYGGLVL